MSNRSLWESRQKLDALLDMWVEDGATAAGNPPTPEHIDALRDAEVGQASEVAQAHREGRGPPDWAGGGNPGQGGGAGG